jgi:phage-related tail fiber protein
MAKFKTIITTAGAAKIAAVLAGTASIVLDNTAKMAVGDGGGTLPTPNPAQTKLVNEVHRAPINRASIDASDPKNIVAELVIPPETGGFWLREMALYDAAGTLLAVGNMADTYKPSLSEGAGRKMVIRMVIAVSEVNAITITMDTATVMATQEYVDSEIDKHAKSRNHPDATLTAKGFTQLNSATNSASETQAATPKAVKTVMDATSLKAPLASPALTGKPTAPTAAQTASDTQIANTAFVKAAIDALINASPGALDTLGELAAALGNDPNFATTMVNALAAKAPLANPALTGKPTAPTASQSSNDTQLATTEFVTRAVAPAILMRGNLPNNANLNNYGPTSDYIGKWGQSGNGTATTANGYPATERGVFEVYPGGRSNCTQTYTTDGGRFFIRFLNGTWNGTDGPWVDWIEVGGLSSAKVLPTSVTTLSDYTAFAQNTTYILSGQRTDSPVGLSAGQNNSIIMSLRRTGGAIMGLAQLMFTGAGIYERRGQPDAATNWTSVTWYPGGDANGWRLIGSDAMAAIGLGLASQTATTAFDWQQADFVTGQNQLANVTGWLNAPAELKNPAGDVVNIACEGARASANRFFLRVTSQSMTASARYEYFVVINGAKGSRTFNVVQEFNSDPTTVIPLSNGGLGATTPAGGRKTLGFEDLGYGIAVQPVADPLDWQQADFVTGQKRLATVGAWVNAPVGLTLGVSVVANIECVLAQVNRLVLRVTSNAQSASNRSEYIVTSTGVKGNRNFNVVQNFNSDSSTIIPIANGGTGEKTPAGARDNLGLSAGLPPIGIPFFWPSAAMPNTVMPEWADMVFLKFNGATFSAATYPKLALVWPGLKLTEARGEFLRIWDDGRGVDSGRALLSAQGDAQQPITGQFVDVTMGVNAAASGAFEMTQLIPTGLVAGTTSTFNQKNIYFDSAKQVRAAPENRPRNIAFNLLVRAK